MKLNSKAIANQQPISSIYAMGKVDEKTHATFSDNLNPDLSWSELPDGTKSLVLICHDPDVPSKPDDVNQEGREVPADLPRIDFFHWVLVDIPPQLATIDEGSFSARVTPKGKPLSEGPYDTRQGINDYTGWFAGDEEMGGDYYGYDGPFPPWNDSVIHHYHFTLYALDVERCPVEGRFTGQDVIRAIEGHVLDKACLIGTYSLNPSAA